MPTLSCELRKQLETAAKDARRVAEAGAQKALEQLAVHHHEPWSTLNPEQRALRNRLRAHGRQLGDQRDERRGTQAIPHLKSECAYEQWHRMLFARFLAETDLLIEPETGVAISLRESQELARERGQDWLELASTFAERMLPQIFRKGDPVLEVTLPLETRSGLEDVLKALPRDVFLADDSLGWVYQFWQAERKDEVNASAKKIGADELPAVTQLFTEDYMVLFLLHNTLGAWWAGRVLAQHPHIANAAVDEDELRNACAVGEANWTYLRFVRSEHGSWSPAAGTFQGWPHCSRDIRLLDPCMGSGHFLVLALPILVAFRVAEEGLSMQAATDAVLRDNLFGLEIDQRCTQIAAFNLALAAWRHSGYRVLPRLNLACSGIAPQATRDSWLTLAGKNARARAGMEHLFRLFHDAPVLGSLINPRDLEGDLVVADFEDLQPLLQPALSAEVDSAERELAVAASGLAKAAELLGTAFTLVATNVPYLSRNKQTKKLQDFCTSHYPRSRTDLATTFIERIFKWLTPGGTAALVVPRIWMTYTAYYEALRRHLLHALQFDIVSLIGKNGFETISGEIVDVSLISLTVQAPIGQEVSVLDVSADPSPAQKATALRNTTPVRLPQEHFLSTPGCAIVEQTEDGASLLASYVDCYEGLSRGDAGRFDRFFWELPTIDTTRWAPLVHSSFCDGIFSGVEMVFLWEGGEGVLAHSEGARVQGDAAWNRPAVFVSRTHLRACLSLGFIHAQNGVAIVPRDDAHLAAVLAFCRSDEYRSAVQKLNQKLIKPTGAMDKVAFDLARWTDVASQLYPGGVGPAESSDPREWYFRGRPNGADHPLQVAVARLVGFQWPRQTTARSPALPQADCDGLEKHADPDGIVCLPPVKGELPATERLLSLLADDYGRDWSAAKLTSLLAQAGFEGKTLTEWLRDGFFEQHCSLFRQKPFVWHLWDGRRDGFQALVNYHRLAGPGGLARQTLESLTYAYLGEWIDRQRVDQRAGVEGADARLAAAEQLRGELERILEGEPPYDVFVRWKPIARQSVGWEPDAEDGVRMNIRPFMIASVGKGACVLRSRPRLSWGNDGGKETSGKREEFPWLFGWDGVTEDWIGGRTFSGERHNDCHYSKKAKRS